MLSSDALFSLEATNCTAKMKHPQGKRILLLINYCYIKVTRLKEYSVKRYTLFFLLREKYHQNIHSAVQKTPSLPRSL